MADLVKDFADVKCVIRALLVVNNGPMPYLSLIKQYQAQEGRAIPYRRFGYADCVSFLESLTDTVHVKRNGNDVFLTAKIEENLRHVQTLVQAQKVREDRPTSTSPPAKVRVRASAPELPAFVEENLVQLMGEKCANVRALRDVYFRRFGTSLNVEHYGFASLDDCLARLQIRSPAEKELEHNRVQDDIVAVLEQYPEGLYMSHFAEASARLLGRPLTEGIMHLVRRCPSLFRVERRDPKGDFILLPATDVESPQSLPPASPLPTQSRVRVSHVRSPSEISVQQQSEALRDLTKAMNKFYGMTPNKPSGPLNASPGRLCAAFLEESWLRGRVFAYLVGDTIVEVDLLDTGDRRWIERRHLRPLAPRFTDLPAQCTMIELELPAGVCAWSKTAGERLREMVQDCWLTCNVLDEEGARAQLVNDYGKSLSALLDAEGLCLRASRHVQITSTFGLHVVRLGARRYIFSFDLSGLLGWPANRALEELERRGIRFEVLHLRRDRDEASWRLVAPLLPEDVDMVYLFPAENIVDAVNVLGYPEIELSMEMRRKLSRVADDW
ncbi:hypothetical protein MTO96_021581 [Rhipicephalus appendiculatus]